MGESTCVSCGECVAACPTGALTNKTISLPLVPRSELKPIDSLCPYCGVGCATTYHVKDDKIVFAEGREGSGNEEALDLVASKLLAIKAKHGPQALAGFGSAKCSNEEAYLFQKMVRAALGTNNVDHCTRLCHAILWPSLLERSAGVERSGMS